MQEAAEQFTSEQPGISPFVDLDFLDDEAVARFAPFGMMGKDQIFGVRILGGGGRSKELYGLVDRRPKKIRELQPGKALGYIPAGLPHHLTYEFGWWHVNGADEFYVGLPMTDGRVALLIFEATFPDRVDLFNWYCLQCFTQIHSSAVNIGRVGLKGYWQAEAVAVAEFNANPKLRTCSKCSDVHPLAYSVFDSPDKKNW